MPSPASSVHLVLPGLLWPAQTMRDLVFDLELPALSALLGHGRMQMRALGGVRHWLPAKLGVNFLPAAALRLKSTGADDAGNWLCLDPVHLRLEKTQLVLEDPSALDVSFEEAQALTNDLAPFLEELGALHIAGAGEWHLRMPEAATLATTPLAEAIGLNATALMPKADNVRSWRRILNEVQMCLHAHPVNAAREARKLATVNSLWPWGEGKLADMQCAMPWQSIAADNSVMHGLAVHLGCAYQALPERYAPVAGLGLCLDESLNAAAREGDAMRWREVLQTLEKRWFEPLWQAWKSGALNELHIHGAGMETEMHVQLSAADKWRFWRKPAALTVLAA